MPFSFGMNNTVSWYVLIYSYVCALVILRDTAAFLCLSIGYSDQLWALVIKHLSCIGKNCVKQLKLLN